MHVDEEFYTFPAVLEKLKLKKRHGQLSKRFMSKRGHMNLHLSNRPYQPLNYIKDFGNTLVSIRWRWVIFILFTINAIFFTVFACLWMLDAWLSGDMESKEEIKNVCIVGTRSFTGYLQLSIETLTTTGYGYLYGTENCYLIWVIHMMSTCVMILLDGAFISVVFLKICKPLRTSSLDNFSRRAVISLRNGKLFLIFRIYDSTKKHSIDPRIELFLLEVEPNNQLLEIHIQNLEIGPPGALLWPIDISHEINKNSPFWEMSASDLMNRKFEIFAILSGTSPVTGQFSVSQTSYLSDEVLWGYRFKPYLSYNVTAQQPMVDVLNVFNTAPCDTPLCSASNLNVIKSALTSTNTCYE